MKKLSLVAVPLALAFLIPLPAQKRQKKPEAVTFATRIEKAATAWKAGKFGDCNRHLREALGLVATKWRAALRAALPVAPEGWKLLPDKKQNQRSNQMAAMMLGAGSGLLDAEYRRESDNGRARIQLLAKSPMVAMLRGMFNMAGMNPKLEVIEYEGGDKGLLEKTGKDRLKLQILIGGEDLLIVETRKMSEDELFVLMSQKNLDKFKAQL